jgi:outer membrane lipoprotein carrier protein
MKNILLLALILCAQNIFAQKTNHFTKVSDNDPKAKVILDKVKKEFLAYKSVEILFDLDIEIPNKGKDKQKGKFIQQGKKFVAITNDQEIYCDAKNVWLYLKENKEVQINNFEESNNDDLMFSPTQMMSIYETGKYIYAISGSEVEAGKTMTLIEFKPIDKNSEYSKLRIAIDSKTNKAYSLKVFSKDGSRITMTIKNLTPNKSYPSETFVYNPKKYPGVRVEDLRID